MKISSKHRKVTWLGVCIAIIITLILITFIQNQIEQKQGHFEEASLQQTTRVIDSALTLVFAQYAVKHRLNDLNQLDGANPFVFLQQYQLLPTPYHGVKNQDLTQDDAPGWYYLPHRQLTIYKPNHLDSDRSFRVVLGYQDLNQSQRYETNLDQYQYLKFRPTEGDL